jgi:hypothetical protein
MFNGGQYLINRTICPSHSVRFAANWLADDNVVSDF